ncbi:MAG: phosphoadenosine phosphosulfate reductase [Clostridia bacterium]|nr:phosphoadenosine phosphosulfate reductase [Clostridia bacterium]
MLTTLGIDTLSKEAEEQIEILKQSVNIVGLSGGKDSMATCITLARLEIPFRTVTAEVWWKEGVTGENPYHYEWLHEKAIPKLQSWGVQCDFVRSKITAYEYMTTPIVKSKYPDRIGKLRGFPLCGRCGIQRDCKTRPCERYYKQQTTPYNVITGIAADEEERLQSNTANSRISILELLGVREFSTFGICSSEGLLSPTYTFSDRGGCWFCPNQKIQELELLYREFPELWEDLMTIQRMPNKVQENFNRRQTLYDIEEEIKRGVQMKMFTGCFL